MSTLDDVDEWGPAASPAGSAAPPPAPYDTRPRASDTPEVAAARSILSNLEREAAAATRSLDAARDALADAAGAVRVAEAKVAHYEDAETNAHPWQQVDAHEACARAERKQRRAEQDVQARETDLGAVRADVDAAAAALSDELAAAAATQDVPPGTEPEGFYATLPEFIDGFLAPLYVRDVEANTTQWCAHWWRHTEAVYRLDAIWRAWEHLRLDPRTGASVWLRDHADPHMGVLMSDDGPFRACRPDQHRVSDPATLPVTDPPAGLFTPENS